MILLLDYLMPSDSSLVSQLCNGLATSSDKLTIFQDSGKCTPIPELVCKLLSGEIAIERNFHIGFAKSCENLLNILTVRTVFL